MAARGEDNLTQIQKYKAMLKSRRNKGDEKATRKPKKTRLRKDNDETAPEENALTVPGSTEETPSKSHTEDSEQENFDIPKLETNTDLSTEPKQSPVLSSSNPDDIVDPIITDAEDTKDKGSELVNDGEPTEPPCEKKDQQKKEKSKGLSLRRKKKSKKQRKETEEKVAPPVKNEGEREEDLEEKYSWKESAPELLSTLPLSKETTQDDNLCVEESPGPNPEADEYETIEEPDGKEKISRAKKFKRWAKFGKGKKTSAAVDLENSEPNNLSIQDPESRDDGPSLPGETAEGVEKSAKEEPVDEQEDLEPPPLPQKQHRRSSSLNEPTDKENESLSLVDAQRKRSASLGKEDLTTSLLPEKPKRNIQVENLSVEQDSEKASSQKEDEIAELDKQNNEDINEVNNEQALAEQKTNSSFVEGEHEEQPSSDNKETGESSAKGDQPKKKKKSLLRKISSKNLKASKKDYETRETSKRPKISAPLLVKYESLTGSDILTNAKPIEEASPEKPNKRKKSGLNLKLPKALKRPKASEYQVIGGAEAVKESKQDEVFSQNNLENSKAVDEEEEERADTIEKNGDDAESEEVAGSGTGESEGNNSDDGEAYSIRLALMNDVLKELLLHMKNKECPTEENEEVQETDDTPIAEELTNNEEDGKANDVQKEEELIHHAAESSRDPSQQIIEEDEKQLEQPSENSDEQEKDKEEEQLENPKENVDEDITVQKDEENEENPEPKEQREHQDIEKSSDETEETVQKSLDLEPKELEEPNSEPNTTENEPEPEDVTTSCEDEMKQPEDQPKESEDNQVSELSESQQTEASYERSADDKVRISEGTSNFFSNGVSTLERSIEASMMTRALIDTYILIDHSLQLSEDFLKCVEMMDLNYESARSSRCSVM